MRDAATTHSFAVRKTWESSGLFGNDRKVISESLVVEAEDAEAAIRFAVSRSSVLSLESGVLVEAVQIDWDTALAKDAKYDGPPMHDNHTATRAKLVIADA